MPSSGTNKALVLMLLPRESDWLRNLNITIWSKKQNHRQDALQLSCPIREVVCGVRRHQRTRVCCQNRLPKGAKCFAQKPTNGEWAAESWKRKAENRDRKNEEEKRVVDRFSILPMVHRSTMSHRKNRKNYQQCGPKQRQAHETSGLALTILLELNVESGAGDHPTTGLWHVAHIEIMPVEQIVSLNISLPTWWLPQEFGI